MPLSETQTRQETQALANPKYLAGHRVYTPVVLQKIDSVAHVFEEQWNYMASCVDMGVLLQHGTYLYDACVKVALTGLSASVNRVYHTAMTCQSRCQRWAHHAEAHLADQCAAALCRTLSAAALYTL